MPLTMTEPRPVRLPDPPLPITPQAQPEADPAPVAAGLAVERVDTSFLETLIGYNARRAALTARQTLLAALKKIL